MPHIVAIADDLTGALETGAKFVGHGLPAVVAMQWTKADARVRVFDTESRHSPPAEAALKVADLVGRCRRDGIRRFYKKTDSTLRGNVAAELDAVLQAFPGEPLFYAPAYPALGRTVRGGRVFVDGVPVEETSFARDPFEPVHESRIDRMLAPTPVHIVQPSDLSFDLPPGLYVCDGETDEDVAAVARCVAAREAWVAAGPGALAGALAEQLGVAHPAQEWPMVRRCLIVNGSLHPRSREQMEYARNSASWPATWQLLSTGTPLAAPSPSYAAELARQTDLQALDALIIFGGDTAFGFVSQIGCRQVESLGELLPGIPVSRIMWNGRPLLLVTKAGGFGPVNVLCRIRELLSQ